MPAPALRTPDPPELPGCNLFPDDVMEALTDEERKFGLYTGERCPKQKREAIITLVAEGRPIDYIRRLISVHRNTVLNVANEFAAEIADYERRMPAKLKRTKWSLLDRIEREVGDIPRQALGLTLKIVSDIEAMDSGRFNTRVEHVHRIDLFSDFGDFVRQLEARPAMDEKNGATAQEIHLSGGKNLLMNQPAADQEAAPVTEETIHDAVEFYVGQSDWKSEVLPLPTQVSQPILPTFTPDSGTKPGEIDTDGRGGGSPAATPANPAKDNESQKFYSNGD